MILIDSQKLCCLAPMLKCTGVQHDKREIDPLNDPWYMSSAH
jgi:hypothetical protein